MKLKLIPFTHFALSPTLPPWSPLLCSYGFIFAWFGLLICLFPIRVKSYGICLPPLPSFLSCPVCLGESGEAMSSPQDSVSSFLKTRGGATVSEAAPAREIQTPRPLYGPRTCVYIFLGSYCNTDMSLSGYPDMFKLFF